MYKVMLVDDDYPVLELIHYAIDWEALGLRVIGLHENGASALEAAMKEMPDILITDIGMPKMDGLELIKRMKDLKPDIRAAILSCHSEFQYAQQAVKLQVQDYLLKDTLEPSSIHKLLLQFISGLKEENEHQTKQLQMEHLVDRNKALMKEKFIRSTIHQPLLDSDKWRKELLSFGLPFHSGEIIIPVVGIVDDYRLAKHRYLSDDVLRFAVDNVVEEAIRADGMLSVHFNYNPQESVLLQTFPAGLKVNGYDEVRGMMSRIQRAVKQSLKLSMSFMIGDSCTTPEQIKASIAGIRANAIGRFYRSYGSITRSVPASAGEGDMFDSFNQASEQLRELLLGRDGGGFRVTVMNWLAKAEQERYPPEMVKDWILKLLLDAKLKLQSILHYRSAQWIDVNHSELLEIDSHAELMEWLIGHCVSAITAADQTGGQSRRTEVAEACQFVSLHLDRKISLEEVAEQLFMNPSYFSRLFKKETGETFIEYVTRMKMHRAKELLDQTDAPVGKICGTLGYDNQSYFIKLFKSFSGVTPVEYRSQQKRV
ncbi:helix-turn-helix domain-containing protein [Paenibacillus prosopidis]|uniref:Two-component system response regulator YesN n=1 Tax=Paenibacillus prosopidis TaxID=630520 RepID=A0A368VQW1_9BACL|nr:helix-turn-helix domain-containing protein [Paenibacillus prosopidis]RCW44278.1 two-component system response regulator YesN [Paenibacillus prosopidis]